MEKQGGSLADRPRLVAAGEILNGGLSVILTPAGSMWRRMRRFVRFLLYCTNSFIPIFRCDIEHSIHISSINQLRNISPCKCHTQRTWSSTFLKIQPTSKTMRQRKRCPIVSQCVTHEYFEVMLQQRLQKLHTERPRPHLLLILTPDLSARTFKYFVKPCALVLILLT